MKTTLIDQFVDLSSGYWLGWAFIIVKIVLSILLIYLIFRFLLKNINNHSGRVVAIVGFATSVLLLSGCSKELDSVNPSNREQDKALVFKTNQDVDEYMNKIARDQSNGVYQLPYTSPKSNSNVNTSNTDDFDGGTLPGVTVYGSTGDISFQPYDYYSYTQGNGNNPPTNRDPNGGSRPVPVSTDDPNGNRILIHGKITTIRVPVPGMPSVKQYFNLKIESNKLVNITSGLSGLPGVNKYEQVDWVLQQQVNATYFIDVVFKIDKDITIAGVGLFVAGDVIHARGYYKDGVQEAYILYSRN